MGKIRESGASHKIERRLFSKNYNRYSFLEYLKNTLYTRFLSVKVSNSEYMAFNMDTTSIGEILLQISVKVTTSENKIDTLSNIYNTRLQDSGFAFGEISILLRTTTINNMDEQTKKKFPSTLINRTSQVSIGLSPFLKRSATCLGIIWYSNSSFQLHGLLSPG